MSSRVAGGAIVMTGLLLVSEVLPFVKGFQGNGIMQAIFRSVTSILAYQKAQAGSAAVPPAQPLTELCQAGASCPLRAEVELTELSEPVLDPLAAWPCPTSCGSACCICDASNQ
jgi:hypothetical protein